MPQVPNFSSASVKRSAVSAEASSGPWWRFPIVWMVVGGPLAVVVASLFTAFLAVKNVDPVLDISKIDPKTGHAPAMVGRNHSAEVATRPADQ